MIRAAIFDIDGVILGHKPGVTFPIPSPSVRERLQILAMNIPVSLCTVKVFFAVKPIIEACHIENAPHIVDAGATIASANTFELQATAISTPHAQQLLGELNKKGIYSEWYTTLGQYTFTSGDTRIRESRTVLFGKEATLLTEPTEEDIVKIIVFPMTEEQKHALREIEMKYQKYATLKWGINPSKIPYENAFFTHPLATKYHGAQKIAALTGIPLAETLGVGDSTNDWSFMQQCGYVATLSNANEALKELVSSRQGFVSDQSVEDDGILTILDHFAPELPQLVSPTHTS
ncbi:MAG: HAD family hydrolase [Candidatus Dojkabacteria bacterium]|nr:MAG: HAD family hydrolase [Candidatus Dojkabacteria bacterium]